MNARTFVMIFCSSCILFLLHTIRNVVMQNYSFYFVPFIPYTHSLFTNGSTQPQDMGPHISQQYINLSLRNSFQEEPILNPNSVFNSKQPVKQEIIQHFPCTDVVAPQPFVQTHPSEETQKNNFVVDHNVYKYPKKNAQSNLSNQIFSYLSISAKSSSIVRKIFSGCEGKVRTFYELMKQLKQQNKKYINRNYLKDLITLDRSHIICGILQKIKIELTFSATELKAALRRLIFHYLSEKCMLTVLTSSKLDRFSLREHLQRRREVIQYLKYHLQMSYQTNDNDE